MRPAACNKGDVSDGQRPRHNCKPCSSQALHVLTERLVARDLADARPQGELLPIVQEHDDLVEVCEAGRGGQRRRAHVRER